MVRLEERATALASTAAAEFQFQNGTIRSANCSGVYCLFSNFNSKMVRLEVLNKKELFRLIAISIPKWYD